MKNLIKLLAVAAPLALSLNANAANFIVGSATAGSTYTNPYNFSGSFNDGTFLTDTLQFSLAADAAVTAFSDAPGAVINFLAMPGFVFNPPAGGSPLTQNLLAGSYQVVFKSAIGSTGSFTGGITVAGAPVAAVPEPETYALMLAGLALVGFSARRRQA